MPADSYPTSLVVTSKKAGLLGGMIALVAILALPHPQGLTAEGWAVAGVGLLMAIWWMSEALPLAATALVPLVLFPLLGISSFDSAAQPYANPLIFLFLGGFILARGLERWQLHRRLALKVLRRVGESPPAIIAGMMGITAFLSMWVSNTATSMVMLPIAQSIVVTLCSEGSDRPDELRNSFAPALMLAIAYGATIGGMGTLIGTPPNALLAGFLLETYGIRIGFAEWMLVGIPVVLVLLPLSWILLTKVTFKVPSSFLGTGLSSGSGETEDLGPMSQQEYLVAGVMVIVAVLWLTRPLLADLLPGLPLSDAGIAMIGALSLFILPDRWSAGRFLLEWDDIKSLRWDVLILFGGGLSLAGAIASTGLADWIGAGMSALQTLPANVLILAVMVVVVYLGELASNTAMAAVFLPVAGAAAVGMGADPLTLALPVVLAASLGFMLPVATPPNAIVYGSGAVTSQQMLRAGALLDVISIAVVFVIAATIGRWVFGL
ncbi:SLC13 family permease [uncultured Roseibium sp.]|uniref:SLC13 family permease n=1 Tax=uncultured Roseibium sp. TaxID=1936171 RepID=UPI00374CC4E2